MSAESKVAVPTSPAGNPLVHSTGFNDLPTVATFDGDTGTIVHTAQNQVTRSSGCDDLVTLASLVKSLEVRDDAQEVAGGDVKIEHVRMNPDYKESFKKEFADIQALQTANKPTTLEHEEALAAHRGFLKGKFPVELLTKIALSDGIFIARNKAELVGYLLPMDKTLGDPAGKVVWDKFDKIAGASSYAYLAQTCVAEKYARKGYGKKLFQLFYKEFIGDRGCRYIFTMFPSKNRVARSFFNKLKFEKMDMGECPSHMIGYEVWVFDARMIGYDVLTVDEESLGDGSDNVGAAGPAAPGE